MTRPTTPNPPLLRLLAALVAAALLLVGAGAAPAAAQTCSALDRVGTTCKLADNLNPPKPQPGKKVIRTRAAPAPKFVWMNTLNPCDAALARGWTPTNDIGTAIFDIGLLVGGGGGGARPGVIWIAELVDPVTGGTNTGFVSCVAVGTPQPPAPPVLPTADEIWGAALTYQPVVNLNPYVRGLTGLETFMWYEGPTTNNVAITLNGYAVTAAIRTTAFTWDMGGDSRSGQRVYQASQPGSATVPAATHTYATPGPVVVTHEITWTGTSVLTGPGLPAGGVRMDLGTAVLATARDYDVIEVRTPLVGGTNRG